MKETGVVRRIDELGRIVIPKEIRKNLRIREGDPIEIFVTQGDNIVLKKYSSLNGLESEFANVATAISNKLDTTTLISDNDKIIASAGQNKEGFQGKDLSFKLRNVLQDRRPTQINIPNIISGEMYQGNIYVLPLIVEGDLFGSIIILLNDLEINDNYKIVVEVMGNYIVKRLES